MTGSRVRRPGFTGVVFANCSQKPLLWCVPRHYPLCFWACPRSSVRIEQRFPKPQVARSSRAGGAIHAELSLLAQTSKQEVDGSS